MYVWSRQGNKRGLCFYCVPLSKTTWIHGSMAALSLMVRMHLIQSFSYNGQGKLKWDLDGRKIKIQLLTELSSLYIKLSVQTGLSVRYTESQIRKHGLRYKSAWWMTLKKMMMRHFLSNSVQTLTWYFNGGYLFLQEVYYDHWLDKFCRAISARYYYEYDLKLVGLPTLQKPR